MAVASTLPIFQVTYELVSKLVEWSENFPRKYKFTLGEKMVNISLELFEYIQLANAYADNRQKYMMGFTVKLELLKTVLRLCFERKLFSLAQSADICRLTTVIGKQATGWRKSGGGSSASGSKK